MWEAFAYALWYTLMLVFELTALALVVVMWLLELLMRVLRWAARTSWQLTKDAWAWRRSARELAVRDYPEAHRARPPLQAPPEPPKGLNR